MSVTSTPITTEPKVIHRKPQYILMVAGFIGLAFGLVQWIFGAKYTVDGIINISNAVLAFLTVPYRITMRWELYLYLSPFPIGFSLIEIFLRPVQRVGGRLTMIAAGLVAVWLLVSLLDLGSTAVGIGAGVGGPAFVRSAASSLVGVVLVTLYLTYTPEWLIRNSWYFLKRGVVSLFTTRPA